MCWLGTAIDGRDQNQETAYRETATIGRVNKPILATSAGEKLNARAKREARGLIRRPSAIQYSRAWQWRQGAQVNRQGYAFSITLAAAREDAQVDT